MNAFVNVLVNEVLVHQCHLNGDCQESRSRVWFGLFQSADDCHAERSRVSSELIQLADGCQSERSRVGSVLQYCQVEEDEAQVTGCCHDLMVTIQHNSIHHRLSWSSS